MAIINYNNELDSDKSFYLNNGDLVIVRTGQKEVQYLVCSHIDPQESRTAPYCALMQIATGNKLLRHGIRRQINHRELARLIGASYFHQSYDIKPRNLKIIGRDYYQINIEAI